MENFGRDHKILIGSYVLADICVSEDAPDSLWL